jgi:hypothetical protein
MGEWVVLEQWQREATYSIYNNNGHGGCLPEIELALDDKDTAALTLALTQCRAQNEERARQLDRLLTQRPWQQVARLAAYVCQARNLELKPWETAPCWVLDPDTADRDERDAAKLLQRMLKAGVSQYHPNPRRALKEVNGRPPAV